MQVRALRGVCVGVGQNMKGPVRDENGNITKPGEVRELDKETSAYLKAIGAVEDAPAERLASDSGAKSR